MLDTIVRLLNEAGVAAWEISEVRTRGWEFYFIRHALDQNRVKDVAHITVKVYQEHNVLLTAVGAFSVNTHDPEIIAMREKISEMVLQNEYVLQIHGFFVNEEKKTIRFDLIISFDAKDRVAVYNDILREVQSVYPDYTFEVVLDTDFCES